MERDERVVGGLAHEGSYEAGSKPQGCLGLSLAVQGPERLEERRQVGGGEGEEEVVVRVQRHPDRSHPDPRRRRGHGAEEQVGLVRVSGSCVEGEAHRAAGAGREGGDIHAQALRVHDRREVIARRATPGVSRDEHVCGFVHRDRLRDLRVMRTFWSSWRPRENRRKPVLKANLRRERKPQRLLPIQCL